MENYDAKYNINVPKCSGALPDYIFLNDPHYGILLVSVMTEIIESYWCTEKNDIRDLINGIKIPIALTQCLKSECDMWRVGECIHIRKVGT